MFYNLRPRIRAVVDLFFACQPEGARTVVTMPLLGEKVSTCRERISRLERASLESDRDSRLHALCTSSSGV